MARIICEAIIEDEATLHDVLLELADIGVRSEVFRNYIYVDYQSTELMKIRDVKNVFRSLRDYRVKQTG